MLHCKLLQSIYNFRFLAKAFIEVFTEHFQVYLQILKVCFMLYFLYQGQSLIPNTQNTFLILIILINQKKFDPLKTFIHAFYW